MVPSRLVIGTRGSALARWQAEHVAAQLRRVHPGLEVQLRIVVTSGDRFQSGPIIEVGGKGVWVKEIEEELLAGTIDLAVHSLKDVPAQLREGLGLVAVPPRADARDALISRSGQGIEKLAPGARVGTSSLRRVCQVRAWRPDLSIEVLRGNVDTRLRKVAEGQVDAAILACAGLDRLGLSDRIIERLPTSRMLPAIGQGALAIEAVSQGPAADLCRVLNDSASETAVLAERALLAGLGAGCRTPVAGYATIQGDVLELEALVGRPDASQILRDAVRTSSTKPADAESLGAELASRLLAQGAADILAALE